MRIVWFNLAADCDDPILAPAARWIDEVARRVEFVHVVTMRQGRIVPRGNVRIHSVGKEKGYSEPRRALEFYAALWRIRRHGPVDVCFAHMIPVFAAMAAPVFKPAGVPIVLWYTHPALSRVLKLAHHVADRVVTCLPGSYPYRQDKVDVIGHGIDTDLFGPAPPAASEEDPVILSVGRLTPVKEFETLLEAGAVLRSRRRERSFRIVIVGSPAVPSDSRYADWLQREVERLGLGGIVRFVPAMPATELADWYRRATVCVNLTATGSGDKVVFEALSCGRICLVASEGFREVLGPYVDWLRFPYRDASALADRLDWALSLPGEARAMIGRRLSDEIYSNHSVKRLAAKLEEVLRTAITRRRGPAATPPRGYPTPQATTVRDGGPGRR
jgi:glycosyltransferase involved in cell wall biosynthesis